MARPVDHVARLTKVADAYDRARDRFEQATERRRTAVLAAADAGVPLTTIAQTIGTSHEAVRKVVRAVNGNVRRYHRQA